MMMLVVVVEEEVVDQDCLADYFQNSRYYGDGHGKRDVDDVSELQRGRCAVVSPNNMMDAVDSRDNFQDNHVSRKAAMDMQ